MKLFTPGERRALLLLTSLAAIGLASREVKNWAASRSSGANTAVVTSFEAGVRAYRATGLDEAIGPIDLNRSSEVDLQMLPGVGVVMAKKIIDYRRKNGYFQTIDELNNVVGVGPKRLERWRPLLFVGQGKGTSDSLNRE